MTDKLADVRKAIQGKGLKNINQARKLARMAVKAMQPDSPIREQELAETFAAIPLAEQLRGESDAARREAMDALDGSGRTRKKR